MPCLEEVYFATLGSVACADAEEQLPCRTQVVALTGKVCENILEHNKSEQDFLNGADCSSQEICESLHTLVCTMRVDPESASNRTANSIWNTCGGAPKVQKAILPALEIRMVAMRGGALGAAAQRAAGELAAKIAEAELLEKEHAATQPATQDAGPGDCDAGSTQDAGPGDCDAGSRRGRGRWSRRW